VKSSSNSLLNLTFKQKNTTVEILQKKSSTVSWLLHEWGMLVFFEENIGHALGITNHDNSRPLES
jgi:hypothetical protein